MVSAQTDQSKICWRYPSTSLLWQLFGSYLSKQHHWGNHTKCAQIDFQNKNLKRLKMQEYESDEVLKPI